MSVVDICSGCERLLSDVELEAGRGMCALCALNPADLDAYFAGLSEQPAEQTPAAAVTVADDAPRSAGVERVRLSKLRPERVNWYLDGMVPKSLHTVLAAPGGPVKGLFTLWLVAHHIPGTVLYFGTEDDFRQIILPRALALKMDVDRFVPVFKRDASGELYSFRFPSDRRLLEQELDATNACGIIIDSGVEHLDEGLKANKAEDVRKFTSMLNLVARDRRVLPLDILHTNKNKDARGVDRISHAKTWTDASRHVLMAAIDNEDEDVRHIEVFKTNIGKYGYGRAFRIATRPVDVFDPDLGAFVSEDIPYLIDLGDSDKSVDDLLGAKVAETKTDVARELILDILEAEGDQESDTLDARVAQETGLAAKTVRNARSALSKDGLVKPVPEKDEHGEIQRWIVVRTGAPR
jgi:predicted transcriptional regulator